MHVTERFSDRVDNYIKYRPHYPSEIIPFLEKEISLTPSTIIADIGSGTGISSEMFLKNGNTVFGIEPNKEMRLAAEWQLKSYSSFHSLAAASEDSTLDSDSADVIIAGQAFHWFDTKKTEIEFRRILKKGGWIVLMWNERKTDSSPFLIAYEKLLNTFGTDYQEVNHVHIYDMVKNLFRENGYKLKTFDNSQQFDYQGLEGRLLSSSYTPTPGDSRFQPMLAELQRIFVECNTRNTVDFEYTTKLYYGQLS
jgi:SAM-dependent methyltransferase